MQQIRCVGECRAKLRGTGVRVDDAADGFHAAGIGQERAVVQHELHFRHFRDGFFQRAVLADEAQHVILGHGEVDIHLAVVRHGGQRLRDGAAYQCSLSVGKLAHHAVRRALHHGVRQVVGRVHHLCFHLCHGGFGAQQVVLGRLQVEVRHHLLVEQALGAFQRQVGCGFCGFCCFEVGLGRVEGGLIRHLVDDEQRLSLRHAVAFLDAQLLERAAHLRIDVHVLAAFDARAVAGLEFSGFGLHGHGLVGTHVHCLLLLFATSQRN